MITLRWLGRREKGNFKFLKIQRHFSEYKTFNPNCKCKLKLHQDFIIFKWSACKILICKRHRIRNMILKMMNLKFDLTGLSKSRHPAIPDGRTWRKLGEHWELGKHGEHVKDGKHKSDKVKHQTTINKTPFLTQNTLFVKHTTQDTLFYGIYGDGWHTCSENVILDKGSPFF